MNIVTENTFYLNGCGAVKDEPETVNKIPGNKAVWVGIFAELTEFALFFLLFILLLRRITPSSLIKVHYSLIP